MLAPVVETVTSSSANPTGGSVSHRIASNDNNNVVVRAVLMVPRMGSGFIDLWRCRQCGQIVGSFP
jgi:hypothetical protein